jgi:hypothetical protein
MAETVSLRRWSAAMQTAVLLVAIAIMARFEPSPISRAADANYSTHRQSSSVHVVRVVAHEALASHPGRAVRSGGPWPMAAITSRAIVGGHIGEFSIGRITPPSRAVVTCYDATAPPALLT